MAAQPLPSPEPDPTHKKAGPTGPAEASRKQPFLEVIRSAFKGPAHQQHLQAIIKKPSLRFAGIAFAALLLLLVALPFLINVNSFRPKIESEASSALGRRVTIGNLSLSILSGSVSAEDIAIADDPAFSPSPFVAAKSLKVGDTWLLTGDHGEETFRGELANLSAGKEAEDARWRGQTRATGCNSQCVM